MDDRAIVALYFARDEAAITETDRAHGAFCRRVASNLLSVREDAEECVNDAYHAAWNRIPPTVPQSLRAFLGRIVRDLSVSRLRADRAQKRGGSGMDVLLSELEDCLPAPGTPETALEDAELTAAVARWLRALAPDDRALFLRRYWYGDAVKTLAREAAVPQNRMAQRLLRLRRGLRAALEQEGYTL